jgi:hypothetical protein
MIGLAALGCVLSTTLPGCVSAPRLATIGPAVRLESRPPAELSRCARRDVRLPEDQVAILPPALRDALIALATTFGANADQLDRLVTWIDPAAACTATEKKNG